MLWMLFYLDGDIKSIKQVLEIHMLATAIALFASLVLYVADYEDRVRPSPQQQKIDSAYHAFRVYADSIQTIK